MTLFSSRPPFNDDPEPYLSGVGNRHATNFNPAIWTYEPRPAYDRPQHNPTNPILVAARKLFPGNVYYKDLERWPTEAEIIHARKVLGRRKRIFG